LLSPIPAAIGRVLKPAALGPRGGPRPEGRFVVELAQEIPEPENFKF